MSRLLDQLNADHGNFERLLALLDRQLELLHNVEPADLELMHDVMHYMTNYPDLVHHPRENAMFGRLLDRERGSRAVLERIGAQHSALAAKGAEFRDTLKSCVDGAMVRRELIESQGSEYVADLRAHMACEDRDLFPLAARVLDDDDWAAIEATLDQREDPIFGSVVAEQYRSLLDFIDQQDDGER